MGPTIEVDDQTFQSLQLAAQMSNSTIGGVVARLVEAATKSSSQNMPEHQALTETSKVSVYADYEGRRTHGTYDRDTTRIDITSGPLDGQSFKTPTGAARAVISYYKPGISPNRNGWSFWMLADGSGSLLQAIRYSHEP